MLALQRSYVDLAVVGGTGMYESLLDRLVRILQFHILADKGDIDFVFGIPQAFQKFFPFAQVGLIEIVNPELADGQLVEVLFMHIQRHLVDAPGVDALDDVTGTHIAEEGDFAPEFGTQRVLGTAHYDVRLDSAVLKGLDGVLRRLGFEFLGGTQVRDVGEMDGHTILLRQFPLQLAHGLDKGLRLHISHGAADFGQNDIVLTGLPEFEHTPLDFVSDMGDDLDGLAQICALALLFDYGIIYFAGGDIVGLGRIDAQEPLVVAQVEVGLGAVFGNVALAVLIGIESAGVDVDVRVELLDGNAQTSGLQKLGQ